MAEPVITVSELHKRYPQVHAVRGVSFTIARGETFGLLGPNGAGKTTIIGMLTTMVKPTSGKATVLGYDVEKNPSQVKKSLGVVPQERWLDDDLTARENLLLHGEYYGMPRAEIQSAANRVLKMMELDGRADEVLWGFSGGMLQRLLIARAIMHNPEILIMDEPSIGLDPQARRHMWTYIEGLKKRGVTILLTTHYMAEADRLCDRVAIIDEGVIIALDTPSDLKKLLPGANTIVAEVGDPSEELMAVLEKMVSIKKLKIAGNSITLFVEDGKHALPRIVEAVLQKTELHSITMHEPTLEDVYIHLTGKELRE